MKNLRTCPDLLSLGFTPPTLVSKSLSEIILFGLSPFLFPACPWWVLQSLLIGIALKKPYEYSI